MVEDEARVGAASNKLDCVVDLIGGDAQIEREPVFGDVIHAAHEGRSETVACWMPLDVVPNAGDSIALRETSQRESSRVLVQKIDIRDAGEHSRFSGGKTVNELHFCHRLRWFAIRLDDDHAVHGPVRERREMLGKKRALKGRSSSQPRVVEKTRIPKV